MRPRRITRFAFGAFQSSAAANKMGGAYELQLISRYFGGNALRSLAGVAKPAEDANRELTASGTHAHHHHQVHAKKVQPAPKKQSSDEEELMQVLFNKLQDTKFQGPTHQGGGQPGH